MLSDNARAELGGTRARDNEDEKRYPVSRCIVWLIEPDTMVTSPRSRAMASSTDERKAASDPGVPTAATSASFQKKDDLGPFFTPGSWLLTDVIVA